MWGEDGIMSDGKVYLEREMGTVGCLLDSYGWYRLFRARHFVNKYTLFNIVHTIQ